MLRWIQSRPTESWLVLWTAVVGVLQALGINLTQTLVAAVSALIGALITFFAAKPTNEWGPEVKD